MVLISHKYKFIYIKTKKTGSTTTENFFTRFCVDNEDNYNDAHSHDYLETKNGIIGRRILGKITNKTKAIDGNTELSDLDLNKYKSYYIFTTIRNPFDRMVSNFYFLKKLENQYKCLKSPEYDILHNILKNNKKLDDIQIFRIFIKKSINIIHDNWNAYTIKDIPKCDFYIKQENLNNDIISVCKKLNINYDKYPIQNFKTHYREKKNYKIFYDETTKNIVQQKFNKELKYFKYSI